MNDANRRPLKVRETRWSVHVAKWLGSKDVTPNRISLASIGFAVAAALCLAAFSWTDGFWLCPLLAAFFIQCRLLCNLFDGMVAVEGGKGSPSGELFNDIPDRVADPIILVAVGYAAGGDAGGVLGWCAGLLSVMTAYVRTLSASIGAPVDFCGPMAKQHRMALVTLTCVLVSLATLLGLYAGFFLWTLVIIVAGCCLTIWRRIQASYSYLEGGQDG